MGGSAVAAGPFEYASQMKTFDAGDVPTKCTVAMLGVAGDHPEPVRPGNQADRGRERQRHPLAARRRADRPLRAGRRERAGPSLRVAIDHRPDTLRAARRAREVDEQARDRCGLAEHERREARVVGRVDARLAPDAVIAEPGGASGGAVVLVVVDVVVLLDVVGLVDDVEVVVVGGYCARRRRGRRRGGRWAGRRGPAVEESGVGRVRGRGADGVHLHAAVRPAIEGVRSLRRRRADRPHDADDAGELRRRGDRLPVERQLQARRAGVEAARRRGGAGCTTDGLARRAPRNRWRGG